MNHARRQHVSRGISPVRIIRLPVLAAMLTALLAALPARAEYVNFESSHVHPIDLRAGRLLAVNTPDALLEVFSVGPGGGLLHAGSIPVGLEPVTVRARTDSEAWVVNHLSDSISIVDLDLGVTTRTLLVGDEPNDVVFASGRAFVAVSQLDQVRVYNLANLDEAPRVIDLFGSDIRALATSPDGARVYAIPMHSGNGTTVVNANIIENNNDGLDQNRLNALGLHDLSCNGGPPPYPPLPNGITRNPGLNDPSAPAQPPVGLIVKWDSASGRWLDEAGQNWTHCLPYRLPDHDLFVINAASASLDPTTVRGLGTTLFDVSVNPANGRIYVPHTEARNFVRFEHPLGVRGHMVDNRMAIVDPGSGFAATIVDLNGHIDRSSDPATNIVERMASISQPGMMVWKADGSAAWLTAIGSRKVFRVAGGCSQPACIFGGQRQAPDAVEVGEGPTGVALNEAAARLYVLNRFSNSIAVVDTDALRKLGGDIPLHDPSPDVVRSGRRHLYDAIDSSGHGDAACSSCHIFGDKDELAWDLGDPTGEFAAYGTAGDNVRFTFFGVDCPPSICAAHAGFDPQKGPMTTQTLRGMLEPLHWRGDRPTMNSFNKAFVGLMGRADIGPINGEPAGLPASDMEEFRQMALGIAFPPNPYRDLDDTIPNASLLIPGMRLSGNPRTGETLFNTNASDGGQTCESCHQHPFGATGGKLGGLEPGDPNSAVAGLFNGSLDGVPHSDLKVPHLRNMYEKSGPRFGSHTDPSDPPADQKVGFGFIHDGSIPDMETFLSAGVFTLTAQEVRDLTAFMFLFPTGVRPAVGGHVTLPAGTPPTGTTASESRLATLVRVGNLADAGRHCELTASAIAGGRLRTWYLDGGAGSGGLWTTDVSGEPQITTAALRESASGSISFLCATIGSGVRLGGDRDGDLVLNGDDCADGDPLIATAPDRVSGVAASGAAPTLGWTAQGGGSAGSDIVYDALGGSVAAAAQQGLLAATSCLAGGLRDTTFTDPSADPPVGEVRYYLIGARNVCGTGGYGPGRDALASIDCSAPTVIAGAGAPQSR